MKNKKIIITGIFILFTSIIFSLFYFFNDNNSTKNTISIAGKNVVQAKSNNKYNTNYNPEFYGTVEINAHINDKVNLKSGMYRILAKDFEDGNITNHIEILNADINIDEKFNVNTTKEGKYTVTYKIIDSDNNEVIRKVPVNITKDGKRTIKRKIYDFSDSEEILDKQDSNGFTRGNSQDKQNLGIYLPAGVSTKIWALNELQEGLEIQYLSDNRLKESVSWTQDDCVPMYGENKEEFKNLTIYISTSNTNIYRYNQKYDIKNKVNVYYLNDGQPEILENYDDKSYNCVPFVRTPRTNVATTLEIEINDEIKSLDYYTYDDIYNLNMENDFAVLEGSRITFLLPKVNYNDVGNSSDENGFKSLNDLLQYYDNLIETFDIWTGFSYNTEKQENQNVKTRYLVKADVNGEGAAAYCSYEYITNHDNNITSFLKEKYDWLPLHEIGHGYQGGISWRNQLYLGEVSNNFLAYKFQREHGLNNWLKGLEEFDKKLMDEIDESEDSYLLESNWEKISDLVEEKGMKKDEFQIALFAYVNLFNKTGYIETIQDLYKHYREDGCSTTNLDFICKYISNFSKLNIIPYFERWKVEPTNSEELWDNDYPIPYYIRDLVSSDEQANTIVNDLKQEGIYSIATPDELKKYNLKGNIKINLTEEILKKLQGDSLIIKNGKKEICNIKIDNQTSIDLANISIGAYEIDIVSKFDVVQKNKYIIVKENETQIMDLNDENIFIKENDGPKPDDSNIESIRLVKLKDKYLKGTTEEEIRNDRLIITYTDGGIVSISADNPDLVIENFDTTEVDLENPKKMTIRYKNITLEHNYYVYEPENLMWLREPFKKLYKIGEELSLDGGDVMDDIEIYQINKPGFKISGYDRNKAGKQTVTVELCGSKLTYEVYVQAKKDNSISYIQIKNMPIKQDYLVNKEELNLEGGTIEVFKNNGEVETISMNDAKIDTWGFDNETVRRKNSFTIL